MNFLLQNSASYWRLDQTMDKRCGHARLTSRTSFIAWEVGQVTPDSPFVAGDTGEIVCEARLPRADQIYASAVLAGGKIHYVSGDGKTFVVACKPEFELLATNDLRDGSFFDASPSIDGSRVLIRSNRFLYSIDDSK